MSRLNFKSMSKAKLIAHLEWVEFMLDSMRAYAVEDITHEEAKDILLRNNYPHGKFTAYERALDFVQCGSDGVKRRMEVSFGSEGKVSNEQS